MKGVTLLLIAPPQGADELARDDDFHPRRERRRQCRFALTVVVTPLT
jgi:hypothetical protein